MSIISVRTRPGSYIDDCIKSAKQLAIDIDALPRFPLYFALEGMLAESFALLGVSRDQSPTEIKFDFNNIPVSVTAISEPLDIFLAWERARQKKAAIFRATPKGQQQIRARHQRIVADQSTVDACMRRLPTVDFTDHDALITFMRDLVACSTHDVICDTAQVVAAFHAHGYETNANTGDDFDASDRDNYARWLIGQALQMLERCGFVDGMITSAAKEYFAHFTVPSTKKD